MASAPFDQHQPTDDVELPQLHRLLTLPAQVVAAFAPPGSRCDQSVPAKDPVHAHPRRDRINLPGPGQLMHQPQRAPPRMLPTQLTHRGLHLRAGLMRTPEGAVRPIHQPGQAVSAVAGQPGVQRLPRDPELGRHHHLGFAALDRQHGPVALLDNRHVHQSHSRPPPTVHEGRSAESRSGPMSSIRWDSNVKHQPGQDRHVIARCCRIALYRIKAPPCPWP